MVIKYRQYKPVLEDVSYSNALGEKVTVFNVPVAIKGEDKIVPDSFSNLSDYIEKHCIESLDWQDWLLILKEEDDELEWKKSQEWYDSIVEGYKNMGDNS